MTPTVPSARARLAPHHAALGAVLALSAVLNVHRLSQNGYANIFYSAGVKSMLGSLHNFLFVSFDPGGLITLDKPPLGLWLQVVSAKLFGFSALSLLLPEAIAGVLAVAALYWAMARPFGPIAAVAGALALAVFPSFVAVSRDNNLDAVLILLMVLACGVALRAVQNGRWRTLLECAALVGLAFNTKALAAYLIVPPIALAYLLCAPGSPRRRLVQLLAAGLLMAAISASWIAFVELTPASKRPFVGDTTNNSELGLMFGYNGFGRVGGEVGGPGRTPVVHRRSIAKHRRLPPLRRSPSTRPTTRLTPRPTPRPTARPTPPPSLTLPDGRAVNPIPFGGPIGPLRLFGTGLGDQGGWMLPFALIGLIALAVRYLPARPAQAARAAGAGAGVIGDGASSQPGRGRHDPPLAGLLVLGGWFLIEAAVLSLSKGIVHPYYVSALAPGAAAMSGAGAVAFVEIARGRSRRLALVPCAVAATVATQLVLLQRVHYMQWFFPVLIAGSLLGVGAFLALRRRAGSAMAVTFALLLIAPTAYAATTWEVPVRGTFPAAGPRQAAGYGGLGVQSSTVRIDHALLGFLSTHHPPKRWAVLTEASDTAAPLILLGLKAGALAGYSATDPALDGPGLAELVARGQARYVMLGGAYADRGGNRASAAAQHACIVVPERTWLGTGLKQGTFVLYDCAGRERQLSS